MGISISLVKKFNDEVTNCNKLESMTVMYYMKNKLENMAPKRIKEFELDLYDKEEKACCNTNLENCIIF